MKKKIQKPFEVEAAKNGAIIETKNGHSVRIICYDKVSDAHPIVALVKSEGRESCHSYTLNGEPFASNSSESNLVIVETLKDPQFKVDDYIVSPNGVVFKVIDVDGTFAYKVLQLEINLITNLPQDSVIGIYHKWTIKDAKPGDVLIREDGKYPFIFKESFGGTLFVYCCKYHTDSIFIETDVPWLSTTVRPATYKERQQFFNRLKEEGYKWNAESLTLTKIQKKWRDNEKNTISGYYTHSDSRITYSKDHNNTKENYNIFATEKQAKSALAMARISQIMANDERFGGVVTDEEWTDKSWYSIIRINNDLRTATRFCYELLAFHTKKQADLFLEENRDLVKDYYMMD